MADVETPRSGRQRPPVGGCRRGNRRPTDLLSGTDDASAADLPKGWARQTTSGCCWNPARSVPCSSRSSGSLISGRSATRAWRAFPRRPAWSPLPPDVTLAAAARAGLRDDIEVACWRAIAAAGVPPHGRLLWVNLSPEALGHPGLLELAGKLPSRLVIELTEQDTVLNHALLRERLRPWIARGALVAVDDAGAGFTSLGVRRRHPAGLPQALPRDGRGRRQGRTREAVLRATAAFAREVGARVVAEGVERVEELEALRAMEIDYGQGWLFGRPGEAWPREATRRRVASPRAACAVSGRLERDLDRAGTRARRERGDRRPPRAPRPAARASSSPQEGRLRCQAVRGFWQVFDGLAPSTGIVGRVFRTGARRGRPRRRRRAGLPARRPGRARRGLLPAGRRRARSWACSTPSR